MKRLSNEEFNKPSAPAELTTKLRGILLPFTTPFKANEEIDETGLRVNLRKWNTSGIAGYVALGSTGERVNLDEREYSRVIEITREETPRELAFVVGAGQQSTKGTIAEIKKAWSLGADAVLVITPNYYRPAITQQALLEHYFAVADASPVPVILYSMPDLTGIRIEPQTVLQLGSHPNIIGIKDSSADMIGFRETVNLTPKEFAVLTGNGKVLYEALTAGARGAILAVGCVATEACLEIWRLLNTGDENRAVALQEKLTPLALAVTKRYGIGGLKAAMDMIGLNGGNVRAPLKAADKKAQEEISKLLDELRGFLSTDKAEVGDEFAGVVRP